MTDTPKSKRNQPPSEPTYGEIVWGQFKKSPLNLIAMGLFGLLFFIAIAAPLFASDQPFVVTHPDGSRAYPWFSGLLFNSNVFGQRVDIFFNLLLVFTPIFVPAYLVFRRLWVKGRPGRVRHARTRRFIGVCTVLVFASFIALFLAQPKVAATNWKHLASTGEVEATFPPLAYSYDQPTFSINYPAIWGLACETALDCGDGQMCQGYQCVDYADPTCEGDFECPSGLSCEAGQCTVPICQVAADCPPEYACQDGSCESQRETHILGTDSVGRDVLTRMIFGTRISLTIGVIAVGIYVFIGIILGATAGFFGGWVDIVIQRVIEVFMCFPSFILILSFVSLLPNKSIFWIMLFIGITRWTTVARLVRGEFLRLKSADFVQGAIATGLKTRRVIFRHIMPNAMGPVLVAATFGVASAILVEATLSFLGLGDPSSPSWGVLLKDGRDYKNFSTMLIPGLAIFFTVTVLNVMGEGLRDAMDPKLRK